MTIILGFDTSAAHCAAALLVADRVIHRSDDMARGQAEHLMPMLEEMLADAGLGWSDLTAIGVGIGPGNFTGIRISVAAARGLALGLGIPAVGVSSFEALAHGTANCVVVLDAPRDSFYVQAFVAGGDPAPAHVAPDLSGMPSYPGKAEPVFLGPGAARLTERWPERLADPKAPLAVGLTRVAYARKDDPQVHRATPLYLKPPDAAPSRTPAPLILP